MLGPLLNLQEGEIVEKSLHVFVCSTYRDLVSERNAVLDPFDHAGSRSTIERAN